MKNECDERVHALKMKLKEVEDKKEQMRIGKSKHVQCLFSDDDDRADDDLQ